MLKSKKSKQKEARKKKNDKLKLEIIIGILISLPTLIWTIGTDLYKEYKANNPTFAYETHFDWLRMDEAEAILSNQSEVTVYNLPFDKFYNGVSLTILYNNLCDYERTITSFSVYADNIVEDYSPDLISIIQDLFDPITVDMYNNGWGETGKIEINVENLLLDPTYEDKQTVKLSLKNDAATSWIFESIKPGETRQLTFLEKDDFIIEYLSSFDGWVAYNLYLSVSALESNYVDSIIVPIYINYDGEIHVGGGGAGGPEPTYYVVEVDTSNPSWSATYKTSQLLPAKKTVRLPVFIIPSMSCEMSIRIKFELDDGEVIESTPLENAHFVVSYHNDWSNYVKGELLNWNKGENRVVYFPFESTSKVLP